MRGLIAGLAWACTVAVTPVLAQEITSARYIEPTDAYGHGAVAQGEYAALEVTFSDGTRRTVRWGDAVFEDTAPRLHDFDGDGGAEVITVVSDFNRGARVQLFKATGGALSPAGANAPIGSRNRCSPLRASPILTVMVWRRSPMSIVRIWPRNWCCCLWM